jgi:hypothetical protein
MKKITTMLSAFNSRVPMCYFSMMKESLDDNINDEEDRPPPLTLVMPLLSEDRNLEVDFDPWSILDEDTKTTSKNYSKYFFNVILIIYLLLLIKRFFNS